VYRDLLADQPPGLGVIAPDLPGYGWSGPAPHKWAKEDWYQVVIGTAGEPNRAAHQVPRPGLQIR
jgi:pimeloyl-ACP methyl ester carboxylesterase